MTYDMSAFRDEFTKLAAPPKKPLPAKPQMRSAVRSVVRTLSPVVQGPKAQAIPPLVPKGRDAPPTIGLTLPTSKNTALVSRIGKGAGYLGFRARF